MLTALLEAEATLPKYPQGFTETKSSVEAAALSCPRATGALPHVPDAMTTVSALTGQHAQEVLVHHCMTQPWGSHQQPRGCPVCTLSFQPHSEPRSLEKHCTLLQREQSSFFKGRGLGSEISSDKALQILPQAQIHLSITFQSFCFKIPHTQNIHSTPHSWIKILTSSLCD